MKKEAVVIRNVSQIAMDEFKLIKTLLTSSDVSKETHGNSLVAELLKNDINQSDFQSIHQLLQNVEIRDYLYDRIKLDTGHHVIFYCDELPDKPDEKEYILHKINQIEPNSSINLLYLGGGHGGYYDLN